jgi:hypothetical protein
VHEAQLGVKLPLAVKVYTSKPFTYEYAPPLASAGGSAGLGGGLGGGGLGDNAGAT